MLTGLQLGPEAADVASVLTMLLLNLGVVGTDSANVWQQMIEIDSRGSSVGRCRLSLGERHENYSGMLRVQRSERRQYVPDGSRCRVRVGQAASSEAPRGAIEVQPPGAQPVAKEAPHREAGQPAVADT